MEILIKDGVKFIEYEFNEEKDLEPIVFSQYRQIFGDNVILFTKQKIKTETGIGTIPDGFIICPDKNKWFIIEVELKSHDVYHHIIPQITKFRNALDNVQTRKALTTYFDNDIEKDIHKFAIWFSATNDKNVYKQLTEIVDTEPELIIIIDGRNLELDNASKNLPFKTRINIFKTFCREGFGLGDNIFQIEPITTVKSKVTSPIIKNVVNPTEEFNSSNKKGRGDSDVLLEQIIPLIKSIQKNGVKYYTIACKEIATKLRIKSTCIASQCTRGLKLKSKDDFLEYVENGTIKDILKKRYPHRQDIIDKEL